MDKDKRAKDKDYDEEEDHEEEEDNKKNDKGEGGMKDAFLMIYKVLAMMSAGLFICIFVLSIVDLVSYVFRELHQKLRMTLDPNFINAKTTDVQALQYIKNNPNEEPFSIFLEQKLVTSIYIIVGSAITLLGLQFAIFFSLKLYSIIAKREFTEKMDIPFVYFALLIICYMGASILGGMYKNSFVKTTQVKMKNIRALMTNVRRYIYNNMISDVEFLKAVRADDFDTIVALLRKNISSTTTLKKMMFTYNLYAFFTSQISDTDPNWDLLMQMFSIDGIQRQRVDPTLLLQYKRPIFIANLYPSMRDKMSARFSKGAERVFLKEIGGTMKELNKQLVRIQNIGDGKKSVLGYILKVLLVTTLMTIVIIAILLYILFSRIFSKIFGFILTLFGRRTDENDG